MPETGAALAATWMPALSPVDPSWDPVTEARQRFATLEDSLRQNPPPTQEEYFERLHEHDVEIGAMQERVASMREAGLAEQATDLENEWARLESAWTRANLDMPPPLERPH